MRRLASRSDHPTLVIVGIWTASRARLCRTNPRNAIYWEHSLTLERLRTERLIHFRLRFALPLLAKVHCVAPSVATALALGYSGIPDANVHVIENPWTRSRPTSNRTPAANNEYEGLRLLFAGRLVDVKRPAMAIEALSYLPAHVVLHIAGDGPLRRRLQGLATQLGISSRVYFHGWLNDLSVLLRECDLLVSTSKSESFGLGLLDAAEAGLPIVAFGVGAVAEVVPHFAPGWIIPHESPRSIADTILWAESRLNEPPGVDEARKLRGQLESTAISERWLTLLSILQC